MQKGTISVDLKRLSEMVAETCMMVATVYWGMRGKKFGEEVEETSLHLVTGTLGKKYFGLQGKMAEKVEAAGSPAVKRWGASPSRCSIHTRAHPFPPV